MRTPPPDKKGNFSERNRDGGLVSIIVPVYKVEKYLKRCLDSVVGQTYQNIEVILVDDGSPDDCGAICDEYAKSDARIRVIHKENGGLSSARNAGLDVACGDFVTFVDSDDCVAPDMVAYLYRLLRIYEADISVCLHFIVRGNRRWPSYHLAKEEAISPKECVRRLLYNDGIDTSAWGKLYKKEIFGKIRYPEGKLFEDAGTTYRTFLVAQKIAVGTEAKYDYMLREDSIVTGHFGRRKLDMLEMTDNMARDVLAMYPDLEKAALRRRVYARFSTLNQMSAAGAEWDTERHNIIAFIQKNALALLTDSQVPARDKMAILFLSMGYRIYKFVWEYARKH